jgi:hypothetical protein
VERKFEHFLSQAVIAQSVSSAVSKTSCVGDCLSFSPRYLGYNPGSTDHAERPSEACDSACRAGQVCVNGRCVATGCSLDLHEPCEFGCNDGDCLANTCVPAATEVGAPCVSRCGPGLACERSRCVPEPDRNHGAACTTDSDCDLGYCARDPRVDECQDCGTCLPLPVPGDCP